MDQDELSASGARIDVDGQRITLHLQGQITVVLHNSHNQKIVRPTSTRRVLFEHQRRLQKLIEQAAKQGINTPPEVLIEIEDLEEKIARLLF